MAKNKIWIIIFILPTLLLFILIYVFSLYSLIGSSFTDWSIAGHKTFIGLKNYIHLFNADPDFIKSLKNNVLWIVLQSTVHVFIGVSFALVLARKKFYWKFARTVYMIPNIISNAALGMLYLIILNPQYGLVNAIIRIFGFKDFSYNWFMNYSSSFIAITLTWLPYAAVITILVLAEMTAISESVFESAKIDGATEFKINIYIVLPLLKNIIGTCVILGGTSMLHKLDIILMTTGGGPGNNTMNLPIFIYRTALIENNFGYANSAGVILVGMGILFVLFVTRMFKIGNSHIR